MQANSDFESDLLEYAIRRKVQFKCPHTLPGDLTTICNPSMGQRIAHSNGPLQFICLPLVNYDLAVTVFKMIGNLQSEASLMLPNTLGRFNSQTTQKFQG